MEKTESQEESGEPTSESKQLDCGLTSKKNLRAMQRLKLRNIDVPEELEEKTIDRKNNAVNLKKIKGIRAVNRGRREIPIVDAGEIEFPSKDDSYFKSYERLDIHAEMLKDEIRTLSYRDVMYYNKHLFKNKIVLDVGCGTGILSLFAVKAGAALVIAVDYAKIIDLAQQIAECNGPEYAKRIIFVKSLVEDIDELPNGIKSVDIIVSEWMGYCLLYESMLDTVIYARDKWLKPGGLMLPDKCSLYIAGMADRECRDKRLTFWHDYYGFNLSPMRKYFDQLAIVENVDPRKMVTDDGLVKSFDLYTIKHEDMFFSEPFVLKTVVDESVQALVTFFTVEFTKVHKPVLFSTSMDCPPTHWNQTLFYLDYNITAKQGEEINGKFTLKPDKKNSRHLNIVINIDFEGHYMSCNKVSEFKMH